MRGSGHPVSAAGGGQEAAGERQTSTIDASQNRNSGRPRNGLGAKDKPMTGARGRGRRGKKAEGFPSRGWDVGTADPITGDGDVWSFSSGRPSK